MSRMSLVVVGIAATAAAAGGCENALDQRLAIVDQPRVLAVTSEPPEVAPGATATLTALLASPSGPLAAVPAWSLCDAPKPPTVDNAVADGCVADTVTPLGDATAITATIPTDACRTFGPDVASAGFRPRDPDPTGGYYQPIRAAVPSLDLAFGFTRITCNLANAPGDVAQQYKTTYVANTNPSLTALTIDGAPATTVAADRDVTLSIGWPADSVESYLYYDQTSQTLIARRESMRVSWFATAGALAVDASAIDESDSATTVSTTWHTPAASGPAY
ncbi:MAG TPA: hypothetical protein VFQ65_21810, partial [Kofleriaceae bacterium]|nr:hypothetical protein [Kofleriaceae bacterium]